MRLLAPPSAQRDLGVAIGLVAADEFRGNVLCFQRLTAGDLVCRSHKIGGSAQRKHRRALLQHGSILLRQSSWTPELPGIFELTGLDLPLAAVENAVVQQFTTETHWTIEPGDWSDSERQLIDALIHDKYGHILE